MGDVVVVVVVVVLLVVGAALAARVTGRGRAAAAPPVAGERAGRPGAVPGAGEPPQAERPGAETDGGPAAATAAGPRTPVERVVGPAVRRPDAEPAAPLADLLAGVAWPCGLEPVTGPGDPGRDRYVALTTAGAGPQEVGSAIGDELERLGYRLHSLSEQEAVARRGEDLLSLRLHPDAAEAEVAGRPLFPGAAPGTVGVELWSGAGPDPRSA